MAGQLLLATGGLCTLALFPPADGRMLIVPFSAGAGNRALNRALAAGARLVAPGPLPGSFVIEANRARISEALGATRILVLAAPAAGCGRELPA